MSWQHIRITCFGGPEVLELAEQPTIPEPGPGEVRIKILAAGTGFTDSSIRRGRYPDFKGIEINWYDDVTFLNEALGLD